MACLLVLFFASGCAALIYETVWFYLVQLVVGASSISVAVLLCAFMGGMALGSWLLPKADTARRASVSRGRGARSRNRAFRHRDSARASLLQRVYLTLAEPGAGAVTLRAFVCVLVLTPPTMLMGATLPAIARWLAAGASRTRSASSTWPTSPVARPARCSRASTLLRVHDTVVATAVAVTLNCDRCGRVLADGRSRSRAQLAPEAPRTLRHLRHLASRRAGLRGRGLSGFTALGAEVVWTRQLSLLFGASVYTFSLILAVFLTGLGIGGLFGSRLARAHHDPARGAGMIQVALVLAIAFGARAIVNLLPHWQPTRCSCRRSALVAVADVRVRCAALRGRPAAGHAPVGRELSADARGRGGRDASVGRRARSTRSTPPARSPARSRFTLDWHPDLGSHARSKRWSLSPRSAAWRCCAVPAQLRLSAPCVALTGITCRRCRAVDRATRFPAHLIAYGRSVNSWASIKQFLYLAEGATASVAVTEGIAGARQFHIAGKVEASDMDIDMRLERMLGHIPALLHPHPRSVLIVGVGAGVTAGSTRAIHPEVERIVICEIEPVVPAARERTSATRTTTCSTIRACSSSSTMRGTSCRRRRRSSTSSRRIRSIRGSAAPRRSTRSSTSSSATKHLNPGRRGHAVGSALRDRRAVGQERDRDVRAGVSRHHAVESRPARGGLRPGRARTRRTAPIDEPQLAGAPRRGAARQAVARDVMLKSAGDSSAPTPAGRRDLAPWLADAEINRERHLRLQYLAGLAANTDQRFADLQAMSATIGDIRRTCS